MTQISGKTYPVRKELRAIGGVWDKDRNVWIVPDERAAEARELLEIGRARHNAARMPRVNAVSQELTR